MPGKSSCLFVLCILVLASFCVESFANSTVQQAAPGPEIFAPGVISGPANEGSPTFSPDGNTLFFTISSSHWSIILESSRIKGHWSVPRIAPFSGEWPDASPAMSPDGSYLIFVSVRPLNHASDDSRQSAGSRAAASHIWRVNRLGSGWSAPVELPASVNFCNAIFRPSVAADGTIYFVAAPDKAKNLSLFRSRFENGAYQNAEPLPFSDGSTKDVDPEVAPDQSFVIFSSRGRWPGESAHEHLFIVHNENGVWGPVTPLRYVGDDANGSSDDNDARLGPDRQTLYFTSDRTLPVHFPRTRKQAEQDYERLKSWDNSNSNIWVISLSHWLKA